MAFMAAPAGAQGTRGDAAYEVTIQERPRRRAGDKARSKTYAEDRRDTFADPVERDRFESRSSVPSPFFEKQQ
jgi:hypothetical protein